MMEMPILTAVETAPLVLIAEDDPDNRAVLQMVVEMMVGARAALVSDGQAALDFVRGQRPDLVLLDLMMPLVDGFEVARRLRADPRTATIPLVAVSALVRPGDREEAVGAGCNDFVRKPFELDDLERVIRAHLDRRGRPT